ncbi:MAG: response regulator [Phyllobacteriaceae bacterium]|nr:response regulator [Phyllobacteriaceae bacterium]MBA90870.1 response regulator [Phyllobacteriaceae bacterium]
MHKPTLLIVEDDAWLAMDAATQAEAAGYAVILAQSVAEAQRILLLEDVDGAILDFNLPDGVVTPVAHALRAAGLPFFVVSGASLDAIEESGLTNPPLLAKPVDYLKAMALLMRSDEAPIRKPRLAG